MGRVWAAFAERKELAGMVGKELARLGYGKRGDRMQQCGNVVSMLRCGTCGQEILRSANLCRDRMCPICGTARVRYLQREVARAVGPHYKDKFVFLTLTVQDVPWSLLGRTLAEMSTAFSRMRKYKIWRGVTGYIRVIEVTKDKNGMAHPHIHALLHCGGGPYKTDYWAQKRWADAWAKAMRTDYAPIVDIRRVRKSRHGNEAVELKGRMTANTPYRKDGVHATPHHGRSEFTDESCVGHYMVKYLGKDRNVLLSLDTDEDRRNYIEGIAGTRLISFGGDLRIKDPDVCEMSDAEFLQKGQKNVDECYEFKGEHRCKCGGVYKEHHLVMFERNGYAHYRNERTGQEYPVWLWQEADWS